MKKIIAAAAAVIAGLTLTATPAQADAIVPGAIESDNTSNGTAVVRYEVKFLHDPNSTVAGERFGRVAIVSGSVRQTCGSGTGGYHAVTYGYATNGENPDDFIRHNLAGCGETVNFSFRLDPPREGRIQFVALWAAEQKFDDSRDYNQVRIDNPYA